MQKLAHETCFAGGLKQKWTEVKREEKSWRDASSVVPPRVLVWRKGNATRLFLSFERFLVT